MRIYRFWCKRSIPFRGGNAVFLGASNESEEKAQWLIDRKIEWAERLADSARTPPDSGEIRKMNLLFADGRIGNEYETPICEEIVETLDSSNIVTRNRYGALVLNSETLPFLDIDECPLSFREWLGGLFGQHVPTEMKDRIVRHIERLTALPKYADCGFRIYETYKGIRLLLSKPMMPASAPEAQGLMREFRTDRLYAGLCARQNCYRARLTPKPSRIHMKTSLKFRVPCEPENSAAQEAWKTEYTEKSKSYAVCRLLGCIGKKFNSAVLEYHDEKCGVHTRLPLA